MVGPGGFRAASSIATRDTYLGQADEMKKIPSLRIHLPVRDLYQIRSVCKVKTSE